MMTDVTSNSNDARIQSGPDGTWATVMAGHFHAGAVATAATSDWFGAYEAAGSYIIYRDFFTFDIPSGLISDATLTLYTAGSGGGAAKVAVFQGTQADPVTNADWTAFCAVDFTDSPLEVTTWVAGQAKTITLNAAALTYLNSVAGSTAKLVIREFTHDVGNLAPAAPQDYFNFYMNENGANRPTLSLTYASTLVQICGGGQVLHDFKNYPELTNAQLSEFELMSPHPQIKESFFAEVVKVHDGDTITLRTDFRDFNFPLRFRNIDSPEMNAGGDVARDYLKSQIEGQEVYIDIDPANRVDKYGRLLGSVIARGLDMGDSQLRLGYAVPFGQKNEGLLYEPNKELSISKWAKT